MSGINWGEIWTFLLQMYLPVLISVVVGFAFALARKWLPVLRAKYEAATNESQRKTIEAIVKEGVWAAEQIAKRDDVKQAGEYKLNLARTYIDTKLSRYGIKMSATEIYGMIEAAVYDELTRWKDEQPTSEVVDTVVPTAKPESWRLPGVV